VTIELRKWLQVQVVLYMCPLSLVRILSAIRNLEQGWERKEIAHDNPKFINSLHQCDLNFKSTVLVQINNIPSQRPFCILNYIGVGAEATTMTSKLILLFLQRLYQPTTPSIEHNGTKSAALQFSEQNHVLWDSTVRVYFMFVQNSHDYFSVFFNHSI
jgi:hypothetical protein